MIGVTKYKGDSNNLRNLASIDFTKALLLHNDYRKQHHAPSLKINKELTMMAQKYAENLAARDKFEHSKTTFHGKPKGENLSMRWSSSEITCNGNDVVLATKSWYNEVNISHRG